MARGFTAPGVTARTYAHIIGKHFGVEIFAVIFLVSIFYGCGVVGGVVNYINDIYGARTSLFLSSQRMPGVTDVFANV